MNPIHGLARLATDLAHRLTEDIEKCVTREDHIRTTARANEAQNLLYGLLMLMHDDEPTPAGNDSSSSHFDISITNPDQAA